MRDQKKLTYIIQRFLKTEEWPSLLGIIANWENETLSITFFFFRGSVQGSHTVPSGLTLCCGST